MAELDRSNPVPCPAALIPLAVTFRPFVPDLCSDKFSKARLTGSRSLIGGRSCLDLEYRDSNSVRRVSVDPARNYVVVRVIDLQGERALGSVSIDYRPDASLGWVPSAWNITDLNTKTGTLRYSRQGTVTSCEINPTVAPTEFVVDFPPGTLVYDRSDKSDYMIREGGRKRKILPEEVTLTYDQLLKSDTGEAHWNPRYWLISWKYGLAFVVLLIAGGLLIWRSRRAGPRPV